MERQFVLDSSLFFPFICCILKLQGWAICMQVLAASPRPQLQLDAGVKQFAGFNRFYCIYYFYSTSDDDDDDGPTLLIFSKRNFGMSLPTRHQDASCFWCQAMTHAKQGIELFNAIKAAARCVGDHSEVSYHRILCILYLKQICRYLQDKLEAAKLQLWCCSWDLRVLHAQQENAKLDL